MPPSGYDHRIVEHKVATRAGCYELMRKEVADGKHPSLAAAVEHELKTLPLALAKDQFDGRPLVKADLEEALAAYRHLKASVDSGEYASYEAAMHGQLETLREELSRLHVDDDGMVT